MRKIWSADEARRRSEKEELKARRKYERKLYRKYIEAIKWKVSHGKTISYPLDIASRHVLQ